MVELLICWALLAISFPCTFIVAMKIKETSDEVDSEKTGREISNSENVERKGGETNSDAI